MTRVSPSWLLALCALPLGARADLAITFDADPACAPEANAIYVKGARARFDSQHQGQDASLIYDGVEQLAWGLEHGQRIVMPIELDDDAIEFQQDVGHATGKRVDRELAKVDAMMQGQAPPCSERERREGRCAPAAAMPGAMAGMPAGFDAEAMQAQLAQAQAMMAQMDPKLLEQAGIDPEQVQQSYTQSQQLLGAQAQHKRSELVRGLGEQRLAGVSCQRWERRLDQQLLEAGCDAELDALGLNERDRRGLEGAIVRMNQWAESFMELGARFGGAADDDRFDRRGVTLERVCYDDGRESGRTSARIAREPIDEARFELPSGYRSMAEAMREQESAR